jgi:hypothetical protein
MKTKTSLNDIQLAEIIDLLRYIEELADEYKSENPHSYRDAFVGLITSLEYFRFIDEDLKQLDPSFKKSSLKDNVKSLVLMSILKDYQFDKDSGRFQKAFDRINNYILKRKNEKTFEGKLA